MISLVIPLFNRRRFIAQAVKSVLNQTRRDFELVVWDDGSTDDGAQIAKDATRGDPRVRVITGENRGAPAAINAAAKVLSGKYFGWVDSDDMLAESALKDAAAVLDAKSDVGVVYTDYVNIDAGAGVKGPGKRCKIPYSKDRLLIDFMTFHFRLMRRELFDSVGQCDESMQSAEDYDLCLRLSEVAQFHHLQKPLYYYRVHEDSISQGQKLKQIETSARAIRNALKRRGMDQQVELGVKYQATFQLRKKAP